MPKIKKERLYRSDGTPAPNFNQLVKLWLMGKIHIKEHSPAAAFHGFLSEYRKGVYAARLSGQKRMTKRDAHREALSNLTDLVLGYDLQTHLQQRLSGTSINQGGFRTALGQGFAKNVGENFVNAIVYALSDLLSHQNEILVDKGAPPQLKQVLQIERPNILHGGPQNIKMSVEADMCIWSKSDPLNAIVISAKTRLKEVFHVGTMWKMLFDCIDDHNLQNKWNLKSNLNQTTHNIQYVFATADAVSKGGEKTQGPDVERDQVRNLIAMDASFFDFVFVSKTGISHVSDQLSISSRNSLFHELGTLIDLIEQKYAITIN